MKLHVKSASFSTDNSRTPRLSIFYRISNHKIFIPKYLDNALTGEHLLMRFLVWKGNYSVLEQGFTLQFFSEPAWTSQLDLHCGSVFNSRLRTRVFSVTFSFVNWIYAVANQGIRLYSQNYCQNQPVLRSSIYIEPVLIPREKCNTLSTFCFLEYIFAFREIFVNQHVLLQPDLDWDRP